MIVIKKFGTLLDLCVSSLRRGHANLLYIVPILTDDPRRESIGKRGFAWARSARKLRCFRGWPDTPNVYTSRFARVIFAQGPR